MTDPFEQRLATLWQQGGRDIALSFLRRAVHMDMSLSDLLSALRFDQVQGHLEAIRLVDVVHAGHRSQPHPQGPQSRMESVAATGKGRRKRRTPEEIEAMRNELIRMLQEEPGSLNTTQLVTGLTQAGHEADSMRASAQLNLLVEQGMVSDLGGKPKAWRATSALRNGR